MRSRKLMKLITSIFCLLSFSYAHASPNLSNFITEVDYPSPNQNTWVEGRKLYDVDLKLYCESLNVNSTESGIGTSIKKFNLKDNLCDNVRKLSQEGYYCKTQIFADLEKIGGEVTAFIASDYIDYGEQPEIYCEGNGNISFHYFLEGDSRDKVKSTYYSSVISPRIINKFSEQALSTLLESRIDRVYFNCENFNACSVTGLDLAEAFLDGVQSIDTFTPEYEEFTNLLGGTSGVWVYKSITTYGEIIIISNPQELKPSVTILRGSLDDYKEGGIKID